MLSECIMQAIILFGIFMKKKELKSLVTQMYEELIANIDRQENPNKEQISTYLQDATNTISAISDSELDSVEHAKLAFTNTYKELVDDSLSAYQYTNNIFEELAEVHATIIDECSEVHLDLSKITEKFNNIHSQMTKEVCRANGVITSLKGKIKSLERNSNLDGLTKVFNRRALTSYLNQICSKKDIPYELHLLMLDIDDFKLVNDTYGHIAGDKILIFIANMLRKSLRDGDKVFRYGGEEFIIVLNRLNTESCIEITNRILHLIRSNQLIYKGDSLNVTISIGTTLYYSGDTPETLIARADKALYKSKNAGKNQINSELINGN